MVPRMWNGRSKKPAKTDSGKTANLELAKAPTHASAGRLATPVRSDRREATYEERDRWAEARPRVNIGSTSAKRDIPMFAERYLQGRMNLDGLVSKRISLREVNDDLRDAQGRLADPVVLRSEREFFIQRDER